MYSVLSELIPIERPASRSIAELRLSRDFDKKTAQLKELLGEEGKKQVDELILSHIRLIGHDEYEREMDYFCLGAQLILEIVTRANQVLGGSPNTKTSQAEN